MTAVEHVQVVGLHQATSAEDILDLLDALRPAWHADAACRGMTDVMWLNDSLLIGSRFIDSHWRIVLIDTIDRSVAVIPNTVDCTAVHAAL